MVWLFNLFLFKFSFVMFLKFKFDREIEDILFLCSKSFVMLWFDRDDKLGIVFRFVWL